MIKTKYNFQVKKYSEVPAQELKEIAKISGVTEEYLKEHDDRTICEPKEKER